MARKKKVAQELRDLAGGYAFTHAADIARAWALRAIEKARVAAKKHEHSIEYIAHEIPAHLFGRGFEQYESHYRLAATKTVRRLKKADFKATRSFKMIDACYDPDPYGDGSSDEPARYRLVFKIRW